MSARRIPTRRLPRQPNLEQLRKQAKELAAERAGGTLSEAQRELARAYGFDNWAKLKAFVDGANVARMAGAVKAGDLAAARRLLKARPELAGMDMAADDEHRALHYAVLRRDAAMVRLLMEAGADARRGIFPHRDATTAVALARDREYLDIVAVIEEEEQRRRQSMSCPNAAVSPLQEQINEAIRRGDDGAAMALLRRLAATQWWRGCWPAKPMRASRMAAASRRSITRRWRAMPAFRQWRGGCSMQERR
jgi:hypothetical protein